MDLVGKNVFRIGEMLIDGKQVFWKKGYVFACIPYVQLLTGRNIISNSDVLIVPRRQVANIKDLEPTEMFDLSLCIKFLSRGVE